MPQASALGFGFLQASALSLGFRFLQAEDCIEVGEHIVLVVHDETPVQALLVRPLHGRGWSRVQSNKFGKLGT